MVKWKFLVVVLKLLINKVTKAKTRLIFSKMENVLGSRCGWLGDSHSSSQRSLVHLSEATFLGHVLRKEAR